MIVVEFLRISLINSRKDGDKAKLDLGSGFGHVQHLAFT